MKTVIICTIWISFLSASLSVAADSALSPSASVDSIDSKINYLTEAEKAEGWRLLFDGHQDPINRQGQVGEPL
jgi:hypothetical protein